MGGGTSSISTFATETKGASGALDSLRQSVQRMQGAIEAFIRSLGGKASAPTQTAALPASVPHFQEGGIVPEIPSFQDGGIVATVHPGEFITPAALTSALTAFMKALSQAATMLGSLTDSLRSKMGGIGSPTMPRPFMSTAAQPSIFSAPMATAPQMFAPPVAPQVAPIASQVSQPSQVLGTWTEKTSTDTAQILNLLQTHFGTTGLTPAEPIKALSSGMTDAKSKVTDSMDQAVKGLDTFVNALIAAAAKLNSLMGGGGVTGSTVVAPGVTSISAGTAPQLPLIDTTPAPSTSLFSQIFGTGSTPGVPGTGNAPAGFAPQVAQGQSGILNTNLQSATSADAAALAAHTKAVNADTQATGKKAGGASGGGALGGGALGGLWTQLKNVGAGGGNADNGNAPSGFSGTVSAGLGALTSGMQIFGSVLQTGKQIMSAQSTGAGVVQGLMSGATLGMQLGGPIGAAVGAVVGPILGGLAGAKNSAMEKYVTDIKAELKGITDAVQSGNLGLGQAMQDLMSIRSVAQSQAGGSKKNQKAWQQSIEPQIDAQIQALQNQIEQVITNLHSTLEEITQPTAFQPFLSSLDQIIQKYQQFAQAAVGNSQEVANANLFLSQSLQNYLVTLGTQLNDQQQQAIQNALQLIDLQQQQLQLDQQHAQSVYSILTQGVMGRQETTAQSKGSQIEQLDETYDAQSQQNQEQIQIAQYRYDTEQKIFGLASDRVGLEQQLLQVQEQQVDQQVQSITALIAVMQALQQGIAGGPSALANLVGGPTGVGGLQGLLQLLGLSDSGQQPGQRVATINDVPSQYQQYVNYLTTGPIPDIMMLLQQAETTQSVRQMLDDELTSSQMQSELAGAGIPMGAEWSSFINWIMAGAPGLPPPPSYQVGGLVDTTGLANVHQGEYIFPSGTFQQFVDAMGTLIEAINTLAQEVNSLVTGQTATAVGATSPALETAGANALARQGTTLTSSFFGGGMIAGMTVSLSNDSLNKLANIWKLIITSLAPTKTLNLPQYQQGGVVPATGPALLHAGETVIPTGAVAQSAGKALGQVSASNELAIHQQILSLAQTRIGMETQLVQLQQQQTQNDMQRISMLSDLLTKMSGVNIGSSSGVSSLEGGLMRIYQLRGRYGSGGFRTETL